MVNDARTSFNIEAVNLDKFCSIMDHINPELTSILKEWEPPKNYRIYKAKYHYGANILDQGKLQLPLQSGSVIPFDDPAVPQQIKKDLSYIPFAIENARKG